MPLFACGRAISQPDQTANESNVRLFGALGGQPVEVGRSGRLQLAAARLRVRQPAQPIDDGQQDLGVVRHSELPDEIKVH